MALFRPILALLLVGVMAAVARPAESQPRPIELLFFGDHGSHQPLDRYRILKELWGHRGIYLTFEKRMDELTPETLAKHDVLLVYANHQALPPAQVAAVKDFVEGGGGLVAVHGESSVFKREHDDYVKLVGGQAEVVGRDTFTARVVEPEHPLMKGFEPFETWDETRRHRRLADDLTVLQRHGEEPWTWVRGQGKGRAFYTAHGHDERCWRQEGFHDLLERGIRWAAGEGVTPLVLPELKYEVPLLPAHYETGRPVPKIQSPLSPADSMKRAQVPAGFELSLFAAEPDVVNPIAITWDHRDRLWVVEALDYPNGPGVGNDRLKICEDTDGDGKADQFTVFADQLTIATSAVHANGGVIVTSGSQMLFLKDTDGDDKADERRVLFEGFKTHDTHAGVSNLRYGFDGWIHATIGYAGFEGVVGGRPVKFDTGVFRFLPDGSQLEFLGKTTNNTRGLGFTEGFDIHGSTASGRRRRPGAPRGPRDDGFPDHPRRPGFRRLGAAGRAVRQRPGPREIPPLYRGGRPFHLHRAALSGELVEPRRLRVRADRPSRFTGMVEDGERRLHHRVRRQQPLREFRRLVRAGGRGDRSRRRGVDRGLVPHHRPAQPARRAFRADEGRAREGRGLRDAAAGQADGADLPGFSEGQCRAGGGEAGSGGLRGADSRSFRSLPDPPAPCAAVTHRMGRISKSGPWRGPP
jgi:type 1 glutamine amidotransferase